MSRLWARALLVIASALVAGATATLGARASALGAAASDTAGKIFFLDRSEYPTFVNPDGTGLRSALVGRGQARRYLVDSNTVAFSPDGRRLAFSCAKPVAQRLPGICVERIDGTGRRQIVPPPSGAYSGDREPSWSRDGKLVAFVTSLATGNSRAPEKTFIEVVGADGRGLRRLPEPAICPNTSNGVTTHRSEQPDWGLGQELVYSCIDGHGIMIAADLSVPAVSTGCGAPGGHVSPDGSRILVATGPDEGIETFSSAARWSDLADPQCDWQLIAHGAASDAVWSPTATKVAFSTGRDIFVVGVDGSGLRRIFHGESNSEVGFDSLAWLPR